MESIDSILHGSLFDLCTGEYLAVKVDWKQTIILVTIKFHMFEIIVFHLRFQVPSGTTIMMGVFANMDIGTAAVIFQLQVEKSNEVFRSFEGNGKGREGVFSDSQIAFQMYMKDMEHNIAIVADRKMSSSIARACQMDGDVLVESLSEEQAAAGDRDFACRLGGVAAHCPLPPWTVGSEFLDDEILEKLRALYVTAPVEETSSEGQLVKYQSDDADTDE
jgi:hypothetical protein